MQLRRSLRNRIGSFGLLALLGIVPAACGAEPAGGDGENWLQLAASNGTEDTSQGDTPPNIRSPYGAYLAGLSARRQGDLAVAADYMIRALDGDPDNPEILSVTFLLVAGDGRQDEAVSLARRLVAMNPEDSAANLVLAVHAVKRNDFDTAQEALARMPDKGLGSLLSPLMGGWAALGQGDFDAALERVSGLKELTGFEMLHRLHSALMSDVAGHKEDARTGYDTALSQVGSASLRFAWLAGNFHERTGESQRAVEIYEEFLEQNPNSSLVEPLLARARAGGDATPLVKDAKDGMAEVLFNVASLLSQERSDNLALVHVQQALELKPDFLMAQVLLGELLQSQDRGTEAIAAYRRIPQESSFSWMVRLRIAEELERMEQMDEAIVELDRLAELRPSHYEPLYRKGNMLRVAERFEDAIGAYSDAISRIDKAEPQHWSLYYFRGISYERSGDWDRAEPDFLKSLELEPEQPYVMNYLAYSWVEKKENLERAEEMLVRAVELRPNDGFIVDSLGWVFYRLGRYEEAAEQLERAVELRPQDPVINDHLGDAFWKVGRKTEARFQWRRALNLDPEEDQVQLIEDKIRSGLTDEPKDT